MTGAEFAELTAPAPVGQDSVDRRVDRQSGRGRGDDVSGTTSVQSVPRRFTVGSPGLTLRVGIDALLIFGASDPLGQYSPVV